jgi:membrane protein
VSGLYASHVLKGMSATYGMFAIVLGALAWIFLQARVVVYAAEVNVVRYDRLWPRSLVTTPGSDVGQATDGAGAPRAAPVD